VADVRPSTGLLIDVVWEEREDRLADFAKWSGEEISPRAHASAADAGRTSSTSDQALDVVAPGLDRIHVGAFTRDLEKAVVVRPSTR
jgi:hypothetical protein